MPKKTKASTATLAEVAVSHLPAPTEQQPLSGVSPSAPTPQMASESIVLIDTKIHGVTASWSPTETQDAMDTVQFAVQQVAAQGESKMAIGERFNKFAKDHGDDKTRTLIKATASLGLAGLSESNIGLYRIRATMLVTQFPNPLVRKFVLALTGGEGIIVRDEDSDAEEKPYILSPFYQNAVTKHGAAPDTKVEETAEKYARVICATAKGLRSEARNQPEDSRVKGKFKDFRHYLIGKSGDAGMIAKHESLIWQQLYSLVEAVSQATSDYNQFEAFIGKLDKLNDLKADEHKPAARKVKAA